MREKLGGGTRVIEITLLEESHAERAETFLTGLPGVAALRREKLHLRFDLAGDEREQAALLTRLVQEGIAVRRFEERQASFEEILIQVSQEAGK